MGEVHSPGISRERLRSNPHDQHITLIGKLLEALKIRSCFEQRGTSQCARLRFRMGAVLAANIHSASATVGRSDGSINSRASKKLQDTVLYRRHWRVRHGFARSGDTCS